MIKLMLLKFYVFLFTNINKFRSNENRINQSSFKGYELIHGVFFKNGKTPHYFVDGVLVELIIDHCDFFYHDVYMTDGVLTGQLGSQLYQLDDQGAVITDGVFHSDFIANQNLKAVTETEYFKDHREKTFPINIEHAGFNKIICQFKLNNKESKFSALGEGATYAILQAGNKKIPFKNGFLEFHEIYMDRKNRLVGQIGNTKILLKENGFPL